MLNFNNQAFNPANNLTDGLFGPVESFYAGPTYTLPLRGYNGKALPTVVFWGTDSALQHLTVSTCCTFAFDDGVSWTYSCTCNLQQLDFFATTFAFQTNEIQVYQDSARL